MTHNYFVGFQKILNFEILKIIMQFFDTRIQVTYFLKIINKSLKLYKIIIIASYNMPIE